MEQKKIDPARLVPMDIFETDYPLRVELAYASEENFTGEAFYRPGTRLWLQEDLAAVVVLAARLCEAEFGYRMVLHDGLRTVSAQEAMQETVLVQQNPHWLAPESRMLSLPGTGGHPRGWAVDVSLETADGRPVPMGTAFDELSVAGNGPDINRAHRAYERLPCDIKNNRKILESAMTRAAEKLGVTLLPLPTEWWDFRVPSEIGDAWAPLSDADLPPQMRMTGRFRGDNGLTDFPETHFAGLKARIEAKISPFCTPGGNGPRGTSGSHSQSCPPLPPAP